MPVAIVDTGKRGHKVAEVSRSGMAASMASRGIETWYLPSSATVFLCRMFVGSSETT